MIRGRCMEAWKGVTVVRKCDSPQKVCQLVGRCDGHGGGVRGWRAVMVIREV